MNRERKYRAWDGEKMHYNVVPWQWDFVISLAWHKCERSTGKGILGSGGKEGDFLVPGIRYEKLMDWTGLKDKNGKEIYESDLVEVLVFNKRGKDTREIARVVFKCGAFCIENENFSELLYKRCEANPLNEFFECEVIGNIYEPASVVANPNSNSTDH